MRERQFVNVKRTTCNDCSGILGEQMATDSEPVDLLCAVVSH